MACENAGIAEVLPLSIIVEGSRALALGLQPLNVGFGHFSGPHEVALLTPQDSQALPNHESHIHTAFREVH
jgi:hypothetical protein